MDQMKGVISGKLAYFWESSNAYKLIVSQENQVTNEMIVS